MITLRFRPRFLIINRFSQSSSTLVESDECDNDVDSDDSEEAYERKFWSDDASRRKPLSMNSPEYMHALSLGLANPSVRPTFSPNSYGLCD